MRRPVHLILLAFKPGCELSIQPFLSLVSIILEEGTLGQISSTWRASEAQKLAGAIHRGRPPRTYIQSCPPTGFCQAWLTFTPSQASPANSSPTYHADEVDAQEDLAGGLEGTAAGFPPVELPGTAGQHKKTTDDGNCA